MLEDGWRLYWVELRAEGGRSHQRVMMTRWWLFIVYVVVIFVSMCIIERKKKNTYLGLATRLRHKPLPSCLLLS